MEELNILYLARRSLESGPFLKVFELRLWLVAVTMRFETQSRIRSCDATENLSVTILGVELHSVEVKYSCLLLLHRPGS